MKKLLLLAACLATLSMSAQDYTLTKVWESAEVPANADNRAGFGKGGYFYINDKATQTINVFDAEGMITNVYPNGGANCGVTLDQAGNIIVSLATFPNGWVCDGETPALRVISPDGTQTLEIPIPADYPLTGRQDMIGFAKGNMLTDGEIYLTGATDMGDKVLRLVVTDGALDEDNTYIANIDAGLGSSAISGTVINAWTDADGNDRLLHVTRNALPLNLYFDGDDLVGEKWSLPNKGACMGAFPFVFDGKNMVVYPTLPNYLDGFAIAEVGAEAPIAEVEAVATANANAFQANWLNAEVVDEYTVNIYQYYPGGHMTMWKLTKPNTAVTNVNASKTVKGVKYVNAAGQVSSTAFDGVNMVVTTYTDGTQNTVKVVK